MNYILLIRDIEKAPRSYTHLVQWCKSWFDMFFLIIFQEIRYFENENLQVVMLTFKPQYDINDARKQLENEKLFDYFIAFKNSDCSSSSYEKMIGEILQIETKEEQAILWKPLK